MADTISLDLFNKRFEQLNEMHRELRRDLRSMAESMVQLSRMIQNLDRRISGVDARMGALEQRLGDVKDELEGTIKMEVGGAIAHLETRLEQYIDRRFDEFRSGPPSIGFSED